MFIPAKAHQMLTDIDSHQTGTEVKTDQLLPSQPVSVATEGWRGTDEGRNTAHHSKSSQMPETFNCSGACDWEAAE